MNKTCGNCTQFNPIEESTSKCLGEPAMGFCAWIDEVVYASDDPWTYRCFDLPEDRI